MVLTGTILPLAIVAWPLLARIDARRPASWIGLAVAAAAPWAGTDIGAIALAAVAVIAAVGALPEGPGRRLGVAWLLERAAWPAAGVSAGGLATLLVPTASGLVALAAVLGVVLATVTVVVTSRPTASAADSASVSLAIAAMSAGAGMVTHSMAVAAATWFLMAAGAMGFVRSRWPGMGTEGRLPRGTGDMSGGGLVSQSPVRRLLGRVAMATMVAAMAVWLVLDHERADLAVLVGMVWMVCLAVPAGFLQEWCGPSWRGLLRSAAHQRRGVRFGGLTVGIAMPSTIRHAAVLGWPAIVAAAVGFGGPAGPWPGLGVAVGIVSVAAGIIVIDAIGSTCGSSQESSWAACMMIVAVALFVASTYGVAWLPSLPLLPGR
ncbi:MAG: hypothetical protein ACKOYJ_04735 [Planctomycetia bacterium]